MESYKPLILEEGYQVGIWGLGYIGLYGSLYGTTRSAWCGMRCQRRTGCLRSTRRALHAGNGLLARFRFKTGWSTMGISRRPITGVI